mmetsp:Transcript_18473/g.47377  ORF Transcript_18473/g.47377 Transcript_18473/m.47377 type:complete len:273 (-) Transcript_18473:85-903(-)
MRLPKRCRSPRKYSRLWKVSWHLPSKMCRNLSWKHCRWAQCARSKWSMPCYGSGRRRGSERPCSSRKPIAFRRSKRPCRLGRCWSRRYRQRSSRCSFARLDSWQKKSGRARSQYSFWIVFETRTARRWFLISYQRQTRLLTSRRCSKPKQTRRPRASLPRWISPARSLPSYRLCQRWPPNLSKMRIESEHGARNFPRFFAYWVGTRGDENSTNRVPLCGFRFLVEAEWQFFSQQQVTTAGVVYWPRGLRQGIGAAGAVPCFFFRAMSRSLGA